MRIRSRDLAGRIVEREIVFPAFLPNVYSGPPPNVEGIVVNVYRIWTDRNYRKIVRKSVKEYLGYEGFVLPESGWKQIDKYEDDDVTNEDIVEIQERMGFDIVAPLPAPDVRNAIENTKIAREITEKPFFLEIPPHWNVNEIEAFVEATKEWAWGYGTSSTDVDFLVNALKLIPRSKILHIFGVHHPSIIPILFSLGVESFSSSAHERYARKGLYITESSIRPASSMIYLPCRCRVCADRDPSELDSRRDLLAEHNLNAFLEEIEKTRNATIEGRLYEYARRRALTHPDRYRMFRRIFEKHMDWIMENTPFPKMASIYLFGDEKRPEIEIGKRLAKKRGVDIEKLAYTYPFGQTYPGGGRPEKADPKEIARAVIRYSWGIDIGAIDVWTRKGIPRDVFKDGKRIGLIRYEDGFFVPNIEGARILLDLLPAPRGRIVLDRDGVEAVKNKKTPRTDHVLDLDPEIRPNTEVILVDDRDEIIATGKSILTARELAEIPKHPVVKIRHRAL